MLVGGAGTAAADPTDFIAGMDEASNDLSDILDYNGLLADKTGQTGSFGYTGNQVSLKRYQPNEYFYNVSKYLTLSGIGNYSGHSAQGFTVFGDTAFLFYDTGYCTTIDLVSKTAISTFQLPSGVAGSNNHCGQANFGREYAVLGDPFPVMYLSSYKEKKCYVLRITTSSASLVQTLYLTSDGSTPLDAQAFFVDMENDKLVIKMGATDVNALKYKYYKVFDLPTLDLGVTVYLLDEKKCDEFYIRTLQGNVLASKNFVNGGFAMNGKLYVLAGFSGSTASLLIIDYEKHKMLTDITWSSSIITSGEPEQCAIYNGKLLMNLNGKDYLPQVEFV